ncbi:MAG: glutamine amidotransferase [Arachnia sp.]
MTLHALAIRHVPFEDLGVFAPVLERRGYNVTYLDAGVDPLSPEILVEADLVVVLGGPIGVYETDRYPFLTAEKRALSARVEDGGPTLGVCLGAQLIADVLGADVRPTGRTEIGYAPLTLTPEGRSSVLAHLAGVPVLHWHGDEFAIPSGAACLAETPGFPRQAFALGSHLLGLQFHLEADPTQIERWLIGHAHELAATGIDPGEVRADAAAYGATLADAAAVILDEWLDQTSR